MGMLMSDLSNSADEAIYLVVVTGIITFIAVMLIRAFRRTNEKPWPAIFVGLYNILLLLLFIFGMLTQISSEGFGFLPVLALTLPWSWLIGWVFNQTGVRSEEHTSE